MCTKCVVWKIDAVARLCHSNKIINKIEIRNARFRSYIIRNGKILVGWSCVFDSSSLFLSSLTIPSCGCVNCCPFGCFRFYFHAFRTRALIRFCFVKNVYKHGIIVYLFHLFFSLSLFGCANVIVTARQKPSRPFSIHGLNKIFEK